MADNKQIEITEDNIEELNINIGTVLKDNEGTFWKITKADNFMASMKVCDKDGNEIKDFTGNTVRSFYGGGLQGLLNDGISTYFIEVKQPEIKKEKENKPMEENIKTETTSKLSTNSYIDYFVKSTAEFDAFADFEPITNLTAKEAVSKFEELRNKGLNAGIGINIPNDIVFDDPEGNGITILVTDEKKLANFNIFGENFISDLNIKSEKDRSLLKNRIEAYEALYNELVEQSIPAIEPEFVYNKKFSMELSNIENEPVSEQRINSNVSIEIKPVSLEEILGAMEMRAEVTPEGKIKVFDLQRQEYIDNRSDLPPFDEDNWTFNNAGEIFERLDVLINDYYIHDMQEQLEDSGIKITGDETLSDLCSLYKTELEKGNDKLSLGELNLAMGIVNPDTVIITEKDIVQNKTNIHDEKINYVLEKLAKAGIEVVTDKEEFDRILGTETVLQKLSDENETNLLFLADEKELKGFAQKVDDWKAGKLGKKDIIIEFTTSLVLQAITIPANKVSINQTVLEKINLPETVKIGNSYGHDIDIETIKQIPNFLADPIMVYNSASRNDSYTVLTEAVDKNNESILVALEINKSENGILVNNITSAYGKDENEWFIEQIKLGNLVYQDKKRSLEWSNRRRLSLPNQMTTQGSLNVIQKEDIVNKRTVNFDLNERKIEFTENQQQFLKSIGFENSLNEDGSLSKSSFFIKNTEGKKNFLKINLNVNNNSAIFVKNEEYVNDFLIYDNSHKNFIEFSMIEEANANESLVPAEALGKVLSDYALDRLVSEDDELMEEKFINKPDSIFVKDNLKKQLEEISFKNKVENLPAKFISEDIYSSGINPIGKVLTYKVYKEVIESAGIPVQKNKHYLLEIQTDNNYNYIINKNYPRLYEAKWNRKTQSYINRTEINLTDYDSKTIGNIQYVAVNNCHKNSAVQTMTLSNGVTYGFTHNDKIYLNPDVMNSEVAVHEYTHLWDAYIQRTNPELWNKGLEVFKNTSLWNDVIDDVNYADIKHNENLVLSECHARLCGKIADEVLQKVLERDGDLKQADMIDWDSETWEYIGTEFTTAAIKVLEAETKEFSFNNTKDFLEQFLSIPMKDLFQKELNIKLEKTYEPKYPSHIKDRFVLEQNHPDGWAVGKNMWVIWDNLLNQRGRSGGFFDTEKGIEAGNKELNEIIDSVNKSETEALEKAYEGNGVYTCQLFSDYSGYGSTTTRHDMLFVSARNNKSGTGIDVTGVRDSDCGTIRSYVKDYAKRNNIESDGLIVSFSPVDKRKEANKLWTDFSMLAKETNTSFVYQDGDKESRYAFAIDYAQKHNLPCFLIDNEISRKVANGVDFVVFCKDYEDIITKVKSLSEEKTVSMNTQDNKNNILKQCNTIIDKYTNTHFTSLEEKYINESESEETNRHQALMSLCNMKYIHCTTKDKDGYWEINKGKEITANEARKLMSYDDFASGVDRASFHLTAGRNANDGSFVYFNDSERKRDIQPYELTKEDYLLLSQYEKAGGSTEIIPEAILQQLLQYNINANIENPKILSWQEIEDYFSARNVRETKNEVLESFTESQEKPAEKELKEECVARLLENQIDFYGFDTNKTDDKLNSEISVAKWDVLEKIAEKTVSKELDLKPYAVIQEEADKLLMENSVFQECIKNGIISEPDFLLKTENKKDIELTAEDIKNAKALLPKEQYQLVLGYTQGEEGEHFKGIIKEISSKAEAIKGKREILTEDEKHPLAFKYIMGASSFYFSEWDGGDELYGYVVLNGNTQDSEWGYTSLEELKNSGSKDRNGFPVIPEMIFYGLEDTIEKQISVDYPELTEQIGIKTKLNHNEELISEFGKEIFETLQSRKLEQSAYNICCAAQFVIRTMDSSEQKEIFSIMKKCGCEGKNGKANTEDFLTEVVRAENNTASSAYDRKRLYEKINKACPPKKAEAGKGIHNQENDYEMEI